MGFVTTDDDIRIFCKDWGPGDARPIVFHHGWPLTVNADVLNTDLPAFVASWRGCGRDQSFSRLD